jgi:putative transcriptional regulator
MPVGISRYMRLFRSNERIYKIAMDIPASELDSRPMTTQERGSAPRLQRVMAIRRALRLTQEQFAVRYKIPIGTLRDWEQERVVPETAAMSYLRAIARDPAGVAKALTATPLPNQD